jgi:hypothetical protein
MIEGSETIKTEGEGIPDIAQAQECTDEREDLLPCLGGEQWLSGGVRNS